MKRILTIVVCLLGGTALAVAPATWDQATEADFTAGKLESIAVDSLGQLLLSRETKVLLPSPDAPAVVTAVAVAGKTIYAAAGTDNNIRKIEGGKAARFADVPGTLITSLLWTGDRLLAGTAGSKAGIYAVDKAGKASELWSDEKVHYVWAIVAAPDGTLYAATGPGGAIYAVRQGKGEVVFEVGKLVKNFLCLAIRKNLLYAGADEKGLVYEIDPAAKTGRVILDAEEKEISALVVDEKGGIYASTADGSKAAPEGMMALPPAGAPVQIVVPGPGPGSGPSNGEPDSKSAPGAKPAPGTKPAPGAKPAAAPPATRTVMIVQQPPRPPTAPMGEAGPGGPGNCVYYIAPDGLVRTVFKKPVTILSMLLEDGRLILGTGNSGGIYSVSPESEETIRLADLEAKQVSALASADGEIVFGTSNKGAVGTLGKGYAKRGVFTSKPFDAKQIAKWGTVTMQAAIPDGAKATLSTRSGNISEPDDKTWSAWSPEQEVKNDTFFRVASPTARFLQYRLTFTAGAAATPVVSHLQFIYQVGNLAPEIAGIAVTPSATANEPGPMPPQAQQGPKAFRIVQVRAADPNGDSLRMKVEFRAVGSEDWIQIAEKLQQPTYAWDTRTVGDGTYELRVTVSDAPSNPPGSALEATRVSDPVVVNNTPPVVKEIAAKAADGKVTIEGSVADALSRIVSVHYSVDSQQEWTAVLPKSGICDSKTEDYSVEIKDLKPGSHRIAVKAEDIFGNVGYGAVTVRVPEAAK